MTEAGNPPKKGEFELTLLGPGYGESVVLHVGDGAWILVDSCIDKDKTPRALRYLESIGVDPAEAVDLIVATHWHDDHIRGMAQLVESCSRATFCCASALCREEFLAAVGALEGRHLSVTGSGLREIHSVVSRLKQVESKPTLALANRRIFMQSTCEIWSLSPSDAAYVDFLRSIGALVAPGQAKTRIPSLSPNEVAVALWVTVENITVLLGSDLEKRGWVQIIENEARPTGQASVFKVPHHGSEGAYEPGVWEGMLDPEPIAVLTPWHRGGRVLPNDHDVHRLLSDTPNAYATAKTRSSAPVRRDGMVGRTIRESGVKLRRLAMSTGIVRLRRPIGSGTPWRVEKFGSACHLKDFATP